jgi:hypothetical protein
MRIRSVFSALPLAAALVTFSPSPATAEVTAARIFRIPCNFCSLPGTWVFRVPPEGPTIAGFSLFTFNSEGTFIGAEGSGAAFHGVWTRVDTFRYSMSAIRQTATGWQRVRMVLGYDASCNKLVGDIKVDTLTCPNAGNGTCDPQGSGWVLTPGPKPDGSFDISAKRYRRHPFSFLP